MSYQYPYAGPMVRPAIQEAIRSVERAWEYVRTMARPFEGLLGNTCELRIIEFLMPLSGVEFNITELAEEAGVSRVTAGRVVQKFVSWGVLKMYDGRTPRYSINVDSPLVRCIEDLNNALIERMLGEEKLGEIREYLQDTGSPIHDESIEISAERSWAPFQGGAWGAGDSFPATDPCVPSPMTADRFGETDTSGYFS